MSSAVRLPTSPMAGLVAAELSEGEAALRVAVAAGGLLVLGVVLLVFTVWWWRSTRPEPPVLGPLTMMGDRAFRGVDAEGRKSLLDAARPGRDGVAAADGGPPPAEALADD